MNKIIRIQPRSYRVDGRNVILMNLWEARFKAIAGEKIKEGSLVYFGEDGRVYAIKPPEIISGQLAKPKLRSGDE